MSTALLRSRKSPALRPNHAAVPNPHFSCYNVTCSRAAGNNSGPASTSGQEHLSAWGGLPKHVPQLGHVATATFLIYKLVACSSAYALEQDRVWKPRRHHRRMGQSYDETWADELVAAEEAESEARQDQAARALQLRQERARLLAEKRKAEEAVLRQRAEAALQTQRGLDPSRHEFPFSIKVGGAELAPFIVWGSLALALIWAYRNKLWEVFNGSNKGRKDGRWVYDRSMGGRKVWVEAGDPLPPDTSELPPTSPSAPTPGRLRDLEFEKLAGLAAAAAGPSPTAAAGSKEGEAFELPAWWDPPPAGYAPLSKQAEKQAEANRVLRTLERAKVQGQDYAVEDIMELRSICQDGSVSVKPKTVGGRDSIFRTAVETAVTAAMEPSPTTPLGSNSPTRFVAGVASDLGVPEERAVAAVKTAVASTARARMLDAITAHKKGDEDDAALACVKLVLLLQRLPAISEGSAEAELIASSLAATSKVADREHLFLTAGEMLPEKAGVLAEILGFNKALVLPRLSPSAQAAARGDSS